MTFSPIIPFGGLQGWQFLRQTLPMQLEAFSASSQIERDTNYFSERITSIETAEDLVGDAQLLRVVLTAFGLQDDLQNKFLIKKVLTDGTQDPDALSNRFSDKRYFELSKAFGFGDAEGGRLRSANFVSKIVDAYTNKSFEIAIGSKNEALRLAVSLDSAVDEVISESTTDFSSWLKVLGNPPLKKVFEVALGAPSSGGQVDLDSQVEFLKTQLASLTGAGEFSDLKNSALVERVRQNYLLKVQLESSGIGSGNSTALQILQSARSIRF